jgi:hypothetical protein
MAAATAHATVAQFAALATVPGIGDIVHTVDVAVDPAFPIGPS